ncbi:MAG: class II glutamine amidotransferase [bacterium]
MLNTSNYSHNLTAFNRQQNPIENNKLAFGCRIMGMIKAEEPTVEDDIVRKECLETNKESLKAQSTPQGNIQRNGIKEAYNVEDYFKIYSQRGNPDGWGVSAHFRNYHVPFIKKSKDCAATDANYDKTINDLIAKHPKVILAHIRLASPECKPVSEKNAHPFSYKDWSFEHNGFMGGALKPEIQDKIKGSYYLLLGDRPKGNTDSESTFYYFMGKLKEQHGSTDTSKIGIEKTKQTFADTLVELFDKTDLKTWDLDGSVMNVKGKLDLSPACNIISSDGNMIMAFRKGHELYLGEYTNLKGEHQYIVSSETVQPENPRERIHWGEIPDGHMVVVAKNEKGVLQPEFTPLSYLVQNYDKIRDKKKVK